MRSRIYSYRYGIPLLLGISLILWYLSDNIGGICFFQDYTADYPPGPDVRTSACDSFVQSILRDATGTTYIQSPVYDVIFDQYIVYLWIFAVLFTIWFLLTKNSERKTVRPSVKLQPRCNENNRAATPLSRNRLYNRTSHSVLAAVSNFI